MEAFHSAASRDDDHEGEWSEFLQKWDEHALTADHSDDHHGLNIPINTMQQASSTSTMLNAHSPLGAMESLNPNFLSPNPNFANSSSMSHLNQTLNSPQSLNINTPIINQLNGYQPLMSLEELNSSATNLNTIDADNLISTVRQQDDSGNNQRPSWFSTFLQSLQTQPVEPTDFSSSSSSYNNLLSIGGDDHQPARGLAGSTAATNIGVDHQQGLDTVSAAAPTRTNMMYSHQPGLDEMMEHFINYGAAGTSLQEHLSNASSTSDVMMNRGELRRGASMRTVRSGMGSADRNTPAHESMTQLVLTPASSVSSDGGLDDDSSSHEDMKDSTHALDPFDDLMMQSAPPLNISPVPSADAVSSQVKLQPESSAAPTPQDLQDKKRGSKSARVTKKPKRERGAKLAIKIQSDVEVLDDGYKWRKYGQKAVKNSPYPRSYYKCTDKQCKVKKHVERQSHEPEYVVITYEGVHNHSRPDQQLQVFHSQSDTTLQHHDSFQAFTPNPSTHHHLSPMDILGLRSSALFQTQSQPMPLQQTIPNTHNTLEPIDQAMLQNLFHGEPRRSST